MSWQAPKAPRGMPDILPDDVPRWRRLEDTARDLLERYGYREIRTPLLESTDLFARGIGEVTDIVEKEMFSLAVGSKDRPESLSLRPEFTASVVRALLEHNLHRKKPFWKLYSIGALFRYERPQAGRQRQFHQINGEALGSYDPLLDVEMIDLADQILRRLGVEDYRLRLNSLGCAGCRGRYREVLRDFLRPRLAEMCETCKGRFDRNVFRILDCKSPTDKAIVASVPPMEQHLCDPCRAHFDAVKAGLDRLEIAYQVDPQLVRGFDYYTRTVFEFPCARLGAQDAVGGGGRYDRLIPDMGGPEAGAVGFAFGMERLLLALEPKPAAAGASDADARAGVPVAPDGAARGGVFVAAFPETRAVASAVLAELRRGAVPADLDYEGRSLKAAMRVADREGYAFVAIVGEDEAREGSVTLKDMRAGTQARVARGDLVSAVRGVKAGG